MSISFSTSGSFRNTERFFQRMRKFEIMNVLGKYGGMGVKALESVTPRESGITSGSWSYEVEKRGKAYCITWKNNVMAGGVPLVILLQYGHGTGTGGYVQGRDFINPAIQPIFDKIAEDVWKVVTSS